MRLACGQVVGRVEREDTGLSVSSRRGVELARLGQDRAACGSCARASCCTAAHGPSSRGCRWTVTRCDGRGGRRYGRSSTRVGSWPGWRTRGRHGIVCGGGGALRPGPRPVPVSVPAHSPFTGRLASCGPWWPGRAHSSAPGNTPHSPRPVASAGHPSDAGPFLAVASHGAAAILCGWAGRRGTRPVS